MAIAKLLITIPIRLIIIIIIIILNLFSTLKIQNEAYPTKPLLNSTE